MTTTKSYDGFNRLLAMGSTNASGTVVSAHSYVYNAANQRTRADVGGTSSESPTYWVYSYDSLGQVISGKKYWADGTPVAGQQFEYAFDDIGNRKSAASGSDQCGANLRYQNYTANNLNQYTQRTVPGYVDILGAAKTNATVTLWSADGSSVAVPTCRKGEYYRGELAFNNATGLVYQVVTNLAVLQNGTNADIVTNLTGNVVLPKTPESFTYDLDGNLTSDGLWTNTWNGENRLVAVESRTAVPTTARQREEWTYLPDGRWVQRIVSTWTGSSCTAQFTKRYVWDAQGLLAILDHTNGLAMSFLRGLDLSGTVHGAGGIGGVLAIADRLSGVHFVAYDGNGNVMALLSATDGTVTAQYEYDPFAQTVRATGPLAKTNPIRFSSQFADDVAGDLKYLYREYRPCSGRWFSRDPVQERGGYNFYSLIDNNPVLRYDAFGLVPGSGPCRVAEARDVPDLGGGALGLTSWLLNPNPPRLHVAECPCADLTQWKSYTLDCLILIEYAHGHEPEDILPWLHPPKTIRDHETAHAISFDNHTLQLVTKLKSLLHVCMTKPCKEARLEALSKYYSYVAADATAHGAALDCEDASPSPPINKIQKCNDAIVAAIDGLQAYFEWSRAEDRAERICKP